MKGLVKCVQGPRVTLQGPASPSGIPAERVLYLAYVEAPLFPPADVDCELGAWECREFLREKLVGKRVGFSVEYAVQGTEYGLIHLDDQLVNVQLVAAGLATVKTDRPSPFSSQFLEAQEDAQKRHKGLWSGSLPRIRISSAVRTAQNLQALVSVTHHAIIEEVVNAQVLIVLLLDHWLQIRFTLDGISCPAPTTKVGNEGKVFTEALLLQRRVDVQVKDVDSYKVFTGRIIHPNGDITVQLLKKGFGKLTNEANTGSFTNEYYRALKDAQTLAQGQKLRVWEESKMQQIAASDKRFEARVLEVHSGDSFTVLNLSNSQVKRYFLASVRAPNLGNAKKGTQDAPWSFDAREFLRKALIGKKVIVEVEYAKEIPGNERGPQMILEFATVLLGEANVNVLIVSEGLAHAVRPRAEENGSAHYIQIAEAERGAADARKNLHSPQPAPGHRINDLVGPKNAQKTKTFELALTSEPRHLGVVEHVFTGSRFKVRIPTQNCAVMLSLLGVRSLTSDANSPEQDKVAKEAIDLARNTVFQRDVEVEIRALDQRGTFFGTVFLKGRNFAINLLEAGLAVARESSPASPYYHDYLRAQEASQKAQIGVFNSRLNSLSSGIDPALAARGSMRCILTEIADCATFFIQLQDNENLAKVQRLSQAFDPASAAPLQEPIKSGVKCWAKFREDNEWYRGTVQRRVGGNYSIHFFDYGNEDEVELVNLRQLAGKALEMAPLAVQCSFAFLRPQKTTDPLGNEAGSTLRELAWGKDMFVKILAVKNGVSQVILSHDPNEEQDTINSELVGRGLARMERNARTIIGNRSIPFLLEKEDYARKRRLGVWANSEYSDDEDEDYD